MKKSRLAQALNNEGYLKVLLLGFFSFLLVILPIMLYNGGYYIYYGDYNSQQIPFYIHAQDFLKSEGLGWDWNTDLGANFLGSYSFYLLGSPFFWLTLLFPNSAVVFIMPFLLALKHGIATLTSYAFIRRFVRTKQAALIGGLLYAFSGFQLFNIFFNHFHDVTAFFPLLLIAVEESVNNNRRGVFAAATALMATISYFFFAGQVVFVLLYIALRYGSPDFKLNAKKFLFLAIEAIIGVLMAMAILLPSAMAILGNYRVNEHLYGLDLVTYSDRTRILRIIQSFFMIPDVPARPNLFSSDNAKWASIGGYLPLFSMAGVIAFAKAKKKHWSVKIIIVCMICAFIPILNSAFYTFNSSYYARWFYMPILIMAMMTAQALDDQSINFDCGIKICGIVMAGLAVISILPVKNDDEISWFEFANYPAYFALVLFISIVGIILLYFINKLRKNGKNYIRIALVSTVVCCIVCTASVVYFGVSLGIYSDIYINNGINGGENIDLEEEENQFFRIDISENFDNYPMFWGYSSMRAFQSVVPSSIMEFYSEIGITRDVASRAPIDRYTLRGLFSVKYYFDKVYSDEKKEYDFDCNLPGFKYIGEQNGFYVYENEYYIPMGFTYDYYITEEKAEEFTETAKERILIRAITLNEKQAEKYSDIISPLPSSKNSGFDSQSYLNDCKERSLESCSEFIYNSDGFKAEIELDNSKLVFFSVPYDSGWTAYVNGKPADIEKVNYGFMAVKADQGENIIEFKYETPGLKTGIIISVMGFISFEVYLFISRKRKNNTAGFSHNYDYESNFMPKAYENYLNRKLKK